jgi:hypothetical protein
VLDQFIVFRDEAHRNLCRLIIGRQTHDHFIEGIERRRRYGAADLKGTFRKRRYRPGGFR